MKHLIISREYPPGPYGPGGIGTYVANIARLMAERGETVHIIGQRWKGAPIVRESSCGGRLIVHRIGQDDIPKNVTGNQNARLTQELEGLKHSDFPNQWFAWHAAFVAERLIEEEGIDVVEGQEWEAPLYYLLLRRALGIGPRRFPPSIVHLHSLTEFICRFNGVSTSREDALMKRMEAFCIRRADALLCPSHYFARQCSDYFSLPPGSVKVIHLPVGFMSLIERNTEIWAQGSICFVGRLELRKGIIEWLEAAARVASEDPSIHFDFVGTDHLGLQRTVVGRLPRALRARFRFHGPKARAELPRFLSLARSAVVPSRWENFPNVCIEAMSSGLPVIATRLGGMVELIEDGRTGWLAPDTGVGGMVDGLVDALRRCLAASADQRASMGNAAAEAVRRICDNERTVTEQIAFRTEVARLGARRSLTLAPPSRSYDDQEQVRAPAQAECKSAGIVVRVDALKDADPILQSIQRQTSPPRAIAVVCTSGALDDDRAEAHQLAHGGTNVLFHPERPGADAWNAGFHALQERGECGFWLFLDNKDFLSPECLGRIERVLTHRPEVGIISLWTRRSLGSQPLDAPLCPDLEHQLTRNDVTPASAFRADAIGAALPFRPGLPREYDIWDLANRIMVKGWLAVTYPETLAERHSEKPKVPWPEATALRAIRAEILSHFSVAIAPIALDLVDDYVPIPQAELEITVPKRGFIYLSTIVLHPRRAFHAIMRRSRAFLATNGLWSGLCGTGVEP